DDPEQLCRRVLTGRMHQIGRLRVEPVRDIALEDAGRAVADRAVRGKMLDADWQPGRVIEPGRDLHPRSMRLDRAVADGFQNPVRDTPVRGVGLDVVKAGKYKGEATDQSKRKRHGKRDKNSPHDSSPITRSGRRKRTGSRPRSRPPAWQSWPSD